MGAREKGQGGRVVGRAREGGGLGWRAKDGGMEGRPKMVEG